MLKIDNHKKPDSGDTPSDWSPHYVIYRLRERGISLRRLSRLHDYAPSSAAQVFHLPWPAMQQHIADAIGVPPREIWPSRYHEDGTPKSRTAVLKLIAKAKHSTGTGAVNANRRKAA